MRKWEIVRWNGMQLERTVVDANSAYDALQALGITFDQNIIRVAEVPSDLF